MLDTIRKSRTINWPNTLTVLRIFMSIAMIWILAANSDLAAKLSAGLLFTVAAITDFVDGKLARSRNSVTTFGKILDPIADKLLVLGALVLLSGLGMFSAWLVWPIVLREVGITVLRLYFLSHGVAVAAVESGKQKTTVQVATIGVAYANLLYRTEVRDQLAAGVAGAISSVLDIVMYLMLAAAFYVTLYSGFIFMRNNWHLLTQQAGRT